MNFNQGAKEVGSAAALIGGKPLYFPRNIVCAQADKFANYTQQELTQPITPLADRLFRVTRFRKEDFCCSEEKDQKAMERKVDHGISPTSLTSHVASLRHCTCQFVKCWGLPCRHILVVLFRIGNGHWEVVFDSTVDQFWKADNEDLEEMVAKSKAAAVAAAAGAVTEKRRTAKQRRTAIMAAAQTAADLAKKNEASTNNLVKVIEEQVRALALEEDNTVGDALLIANAPVKAKHQSQARKQGKAMGAPTTKEHNKAGKKNAKEQKSKKLAENRLSRGGAWI
jgi:hypothetical protein